MFKEKLHGDMNIVTYDEDLINYWYKNIENSHNIFKTLDALNFNCFNKLCKESDLLVDLGTYGYGRITDLEEGFGFKLHGAFWSKEVFKNLSDLKFGILLLMYKYEAKRVEIRIPSECVSLGKLLYKIGFDKEGTLRNSGRAGMIMFDENIYSVIRR